MAPRLAGKTSAEKLALNWRPEGTCHRWTGCVGPTGYGRIGVNGKTVQVHRYAYEVAFGPIPDGLEIDHVHERGCRFRDCVNPAHLEAVTHEENLRRRTVTGSWIKDRPSPHRGRRLKTGPCPQGHEMTGDNLIISKRMGPGRFSARRCRRCLRDDGRRRWLRKKAEGDN